MDFAYADPPYLGCGALYKEHHSNAMDWNDPPSNQHSVKRLSNPRGALETHDGLATY